MRERWKHSKTCVYNCGYHLIWCPKYCRPVLVDGVDDRLKTLLLEKAKEIHVEIEQMEIMPDHVHLFVRSTPTNSPHCIVGWLKGYTSHMLRKEFACLRSKLPTLWTRGYYVETVGHISEKTIRNYIEDQKKR